MVCQQQVWLGLDRISQKLMVQTLSKPFLSFFQSSKKPKTAEADTSSELAKKSKEVFRKEVRAARQAV